MSCKLDQGYYADEIKHTHSMVEQIHRRLMLDESIQHKLRLFLESPNDLSDESHGMLCRIAGIAADMPKGEKE